MVFRCFKGQAKWFLYLCIIILFPWNYTSHLKLEKQIMKTFLIPPSTPLPLIHCYKIFTLSVRPNPWGRAAKLNFEQNFLHRVPTFCEKIFLSLEAVSYLKILEIVSTLILHCTLSIYPDLIKIEYFRTLWRWSRQMLNTTWNRGPTAYAENISSLNFC